MPAQISQWKADPAKRDHARDVQLANRDEFLGAFSRGLVVVGYSRDQEGNGSFLLAHPEERFEFSSVSPQATPAGSCR